MKTCELTGAALDWAVGHVLGHDYDIVDGVPVTGKTIYTSEGLGYDEVWEPSTGWGQGGPIMEREKIRFDDLPGGGIRAFIRREGMMIDCWDRGVTPLIAAMRCLIASKLREGEVEIPEELT